MYNCLESHDFCIALMSFLTFLYSFLILLILVISMGAFFFLTIYHFFIIIIILFTVLYWFCHTSTWICHRCTHVPLPEPPSHLISVPSLWVIPVHQPQASCILHQTWAGDSFLIWYYTCFNAILPNHPTLSLSHRVQKTVLYICVSFAFFLFECLVSWPQLLKFCRAKKVSGHPLIHNKCLSMIYINRVIFEGCYQTQVQLLATQKSILPR